MNVLSILVFILDIYATEKKKDENFSKNPSSSDSTQREAESSTKFSKKKLPDILIHQELIEDVKLLFSTYEKADSIGLKLYQWFKELFDNDYYTKEICTILKEALKKNESSFSGQNMIIGLDTVYYEFLDQVVIIFHDFCKKKANKPKFERSQKFFNHVIHNLIEYYNKSRGDLSSVVSTTILLEIAKSKQKFLEQKQLNIHQYILKQLELNKSREKFMVILHLYKFVCRFLSEILAHFSTNNKIFEFFEDYDLKYLETTEGENSKSIFKRFMIKTRATSYESCFLDNVMCKFSRHIPYLKANKIFFDPKIDIKDEKNFPPGMFNLDSSNIFQISSAIIKEPSAPKEEKAEFSSAKIVSSNHTQISDLVQKITDKKMQPEKNDRNNCSRIYLFLDFKRYFETSFLFKFINLVCDEFEMKNDDYQRILIASRIYLSKNPEVHKNIKEQPEYFNILYKILEKLKEYQFSVCIVYYNKFYVNFSQACKNSKEPSIKKNETSSFQPAKSSLNQGIHTQNFDKAPVNSENKSEKRRLEPQNPEKLKKISEFQKEVLDKLIDEFNIKTYYFFYELFKPSTVDFSSEISAFTRLQIFGCKIEFIFLKNEISQTEEENLNES
ncbi:hypothetical protein CWI37_0503p0030 [Hamiltosporidium tvaerminnensis]|uniref:Uncharacterized protein n=1 Tax=Hamiltosporidium tvaerminnensis TaxID=1176355 RepID=A0A4Q9L543_9MICR|nr:hypothetical protein CWI37_0503p0030 [Hamiltosporidium tvaerminnensis]